MTMILPIWSRLVSDPETWRGIVADPCLREPIDCTMLACCSAAATWVTVNPWAAILMGSTVTSTRPPVATFTASSGTEFYCPMHPIVIQSEPGSCLICGMPLSKRK